MKRVGLLMIVAMVMATVAGSAAPFSDVPFSHWSYDAVNKLSAKGIIQGYPNGAFKGEKVVDRYSLAMVVAKLLANVEQMLETGEGANLVTKADLQTLEKLTVEFADELAMLGVKVTSIEDDMAVVKEDVSMIKKDVEGIKDYMAKGGMEKVKLSGDMIIRHSNLIHRNDWATNAFSGAARPGNSNNTLTESQLRFKFTAQIDENITAVARWVVFAKNGENVNAGAASARGGAFGLNSIGNNSVSDSVINLAYLNVKDMFRFGGDFTFGRVLYNSNHNLLLNNYLDVARYQKKVGSVDALFQAIYDRHIGSYNDSSAVDSRPIWNMDLKTTWHDHKLYVGFYNQDEPNYANRRNLSRGNVFNFALQNTIPTAAQLVAGTMAAQSGDNRWDVEFGSKGPIGKNAHWSYDLAFAYSNYTIDVVNDATTAANPYISPEMQGWMGHVAAKWDNKKNWAAKVSYTFADDETPGAISIINDMRYVDFYESPTEDVGRGNQYFPLGLRNMSDFKLQAEYRPDNTKHYFRVAGDLLDELKNAPVNDLSRYLQGDGRRNSVPVANKTNSSYDTFNSLGIADPAATVLTFEYRYQLAANTRIRVGFTNFDFTGSAQKLNGAAPKISAGRGLNNDYDYQFFWTEIYSKF